MPGEVDAYLEAYEDAVKALISIKLFAQNLSDFAKALKSGTEAFDAPIPSYWPTAEQIRELQEKAKAALDEAEHAYERVPHHLRKRLLEPNAIGVEYEGSSLADLLRELDAMMVRDN